MELFHGEVTKAEKKEKKRTSKETQYKIVKELATASGGRGGKAQIIQLISEFCYLPHYE